MTKQETSILLENQQKTRKFAKKLYFIILVTTWKVEKHTRFFGDFVILQGFEIWVKFFQNIHKSDDHFLFVKLAKSLEYKKPQNYDFLVQLFL